MPVVAGGTKKIKDNNNNISVPLSLSLSLSLATFEGNLDDQAQLMRDMGQIASAVVIITNQIAAMDDVKLNNRILQSITKTVFIE